MSDLRRTCDFCQSEFDWTEAQLALDIQLRLIGSGLGDCCPDCDEKMVQIAIRDERRERRRERAWERANGA
jgi:hypothetical protein